MLIGIGRFGEMLEAPSPYELSEIVRKRGGGDTGQSQTVQRELYC